MNVSFKGHIRIPATYSLNRQPTYAHIKPSDQIRKNKNLSTFSSCLCVYVFVCRLFSFVTLANVQTMLILKFSCKRSAYQIKLIVKYYTTRAFYDIADIKLTSSYLEMVIKTLIICNVLNMIHSLCAIRSVRFIRLSSEQTKLRNQLNKRIAIK